MSNSARIRLNNVRVRFAWLHTPDVKFDPNFSITVDATDDVVKQLSAAAKQLGGNKMNGSREMPNQETGDMDRVIKFTNRILIDKEGAKSFPCVDSKCNPCNAAMGGDIVNINLTAKRLDRDGSVSFFLDGVQVVEKNSSEAGPGSGFDQVDGYEQSGPVADNSSFESDDAPAEDEAPIVDDGADIPF